MPQPRQFNIDLDHVLEALRRGVRRADVFMGVGLNAAELQPPVSHILAPEKMFVIHLVKQELSDKEKAHVAEGFGKWVKANGLRELLESFSVYLHALYVPLFVMLGRSGELGELASLTPPKFERLSIKHQVVKLSTILPIPADEIEIIASLNKARNCYAHRLGLVGKEDVHATTRLFRLIWRAYQVQAVEPDGNVVIADELIGYHFKNGARFELHMVERSKEFKVGDELLLSKSELKEICHCVLMFGQSLFQSTVALANREGVLNVKGNDRLDDLQPV